MKKITLLVLCLCFMFASATHAGLFDSLLKGLTGGKSEEGLSDNTIISGLKEALSVSTQNAVHTVSQVNGFYDNPVTKISVSEKLENAANLLRKMGFSDTVDQFELSMNRAVEKASPKATSIIVDAIKQMSFGDARKILNGGDTAATKFFKEKTSDKLFTTFKPIVSDSMNQVNVTKYYKDMVKKYSTIIPFGSIESMDLDDYVTHKGLDGLFYMMAEQEKKIRTNPVERTTELLRKVFGQQ